MANKGRSEQGMFGTIHHYDEHGRKVGRSEPGLFGGYTNYDANGRKTGRTEPGMFGSYHHYDNRGHKIGTSDPGVFGSYHHRDARGNSMGSSDPGAFGNYNHNTNEGCYVATCVYGSYDCPEVWVLRRFRDNFLAKHWLGRRFIDLYYATSPTVVKYFGECNFFNRFFKGRLDRFVAYLQKKGYEKTPYKD